ncbi:hypothetical protein CPC08DRAFT_636159 [Agrocybe pediades]|nr:hypothetical protein CPC08DRAFT_636159 [Agrocybe pediades]
MHTLASIRAANAAYVHSTTPLPVAVFVGGTSGIGEGMALTFAEHTKGNARIVIVGRNKDAAEKIFASMPKPDDAGAAELATREFVKCDVMLMKNIHNVTKDILARYPKINYLIVTPGIAAIGGRDETAEGIDKRLAVHYYARWKFLHDLLPALKRAGEAGEKVAAMSVYSAGKGGAIDVDDLELKKGLSIMKSALVGATYNDLMMEAFAEQAPTLPLIHAYPGFVRSPLMASSSSAFVRGVSSVLLPLTRPLSVTGVECGQYMWHAIYHTVDGKPGAWRTGSHGEDLAKKNYYGNEEQRRIVWEHTKKVVNDAVNDEATATKA